MEFEDMKKIWNADSQQHAYAIDEDVLNEKVKRKKKAASKRVSRMEWVLITVNLVAGTIILVKSILTGSNPYFYVMVAIMFVAVGIIYIRRKRRLKDEDQFDRNMLGDLNHAIRNATYQERLSLFAFGYAIPFFIIIFIAAYNDEKSMVYLVSIGVFFIVTIVLSVIEHKTIHQRQRKRLESLKRTLVKADDPR